MALRRKDTVIRIGPISVITLLIIISLATLAVLSLTTAQASQVAADKQSESLQALYANEVQAQEFLANLDTALTQLRSDGASPEDAAGVIARSFVDVTAEGAAITKSFASGQRELSVIVMVRDDITYQVVSWKTRSTTDTSEQIELWQGSVG